MENSDKDKKKKYAKKYYEGKGKIYQKRYREKNKEKIRLQQLEYRKRNPEKIKEYAKNQYEKKKLNAKKRQKAKIPPITRNKYTEEELFIIQVEYHKKPKVEVYATSIREKKIGKCKWVNIKTDSTRKTLDSIAKNRNLNLVGNEKYLEQKRRKKNER